MLNDRLLKKALEKVPQRYLLTNILSRRVRQIEDGEDLLVKREEGESNINVALREISSGKLIFELEEKRLF